MSEPACTKETVDGYDVEETVVFKIYDMPQSLSSRLLRYAKEHSGNKAWVAIKQLLDYADISTRVDSLDRRMTKLEKKNE